MLLRVVTEGGKETLISRLVSGGSCVEKWAWWTRQLSVGGGKSRARTRMRLLEITRWKLRLLGFHLKGLYFRRSQIGYKI